MCTTHVSMLHTACLPFYLTQDTRMQGPHSYPSHVVFHANRSMTQLHIEVHKCITTRASRGVDAVHCAHAKRVC